MNGTVYLKSLSEVAEFLQALSDHNCTCEFEVKFANNADGYKVMFTGAK